MKSITDIELYSAISSKWPRLVSRIYGQPLCITRVKLDAILAALHNHYSSRASEVSAALAAGDMPPQEIPVLDGGIAVIPVHGSLVQRAELMDALSGLTSYEAIGRNFSAAMDDSDVTQIVLDINSPGGEVAGAFDFVDQIFNARGEKPITALINEQGYSAAYAIASAADKIILPRTAGAGSIGVIALHVDASEAEKKAGFNVTEIFSGAKKADLSPHKPLSERAFTDLQASVDDAYEIFVETVARNRDMTTKAVRDTQAGFFIGKSAVKAGLADQVAAFNDAISLIVSQSNVKAKPMSKEIKDAEMAAAETSQDNVIDMEKVKAEALTEAKAALSEELAKESAKLEEYKANSAEIHSMCAAIGHAELAAEFIDAELSPETARKQLFDKLAAGEVAINGAHDAMPKSEASDQDKIDASWDRAFAKVEKFHIK